MSNFHWFARPNKVKEWFNAKGFPGTLANAEKNYFKSKSSLTTGTTYDHMRNALFGLQGGFVGTIQDQLTAFFQSKMNMNNRKQAEKAFFNDTSLDFSISTLQKLQQFSGLSFFKDYTNNQSTADADYSVGSATATVTSARSGSSPATYFTTAGLIQTTTTANVPRWTQGYYDGTGFHSSPGIIIEQGGSATTGKNNIIQSEVFTDVAWVATTLTVTSGVADGVLNSTVSILSATATVSKIIQAVVDAVAGKYTASIFIKRKTGTGTISLRANTADTATDITAFVGTNWTRVQVTSSSAINPTFELDISTNGDEVYVFGAQLEKFPWMTSYIPTTTVARTRAAETLKYPISGNRTAATESIFISFIPLGSTFLNDGIQRTFHDTDTKQRQMRKSTGDSIIRQYSNLTDNSTAFTLSSTSPTINTSTILSSSITHISPYIRIYTNGVLETSYNTADWTDPAWGTNFEVGSASAGNGQINGIVQNIAIYSSWKDTPDVNHISNIMNSSAIYRNYLYLPDTMSSSNISSGPSTLTNSVYEFGDKLIKVDSDTILKFSRTGSDQDTTYPGKITRIPYTISTQTWGTETTIFDPTATPYYTGEFLVRKNPDENFIRIYIVKGVRATGGDGQSFVTLIKSTDMTGASWSSETTIRALQSGGFPNLSPWIKHPTLSSTYYMPFMGENATDRVVLYKTIDNGDSFTKDVYVVTLGAVAWPEGNFYQNPNNLSQVIGVLRGNNDNLYQVNSSDGGQTWTAPFSTGLGTSSGSKVTPKLIQATTYPSRVMLYFYDRGSAKAEISSPVLFSDAFAGTWRTVFHLGSGGQGNGNVCAIDDATNTYLVTNPVQIGDPAAGGTTNHTWWVWKDIYNWVAQ